MHRNRKGTTPSSKQFDKKNKMGFLFCFVFVSKSEEEKVGVEILDSRMIETTPLYADVILVSRCPSPNSKFANSCQFTWNALAKYFFFNWLNFSPFSVYVFLLFSKPRPGNDILQVF